MIPPFDGVAEALEEAIEGRKGTPLHVIRYFRFSHLPDGLLRETSKHFARLALQLVETLPSGPELTAGLRKLLEAKDCAVRAALGD